MKLRFLGFLPFVLFFACSNPNESPQPGIIEVQLKTQSGSFSISPTDSLVVNIVSLRTTRDDGATAYIYDNVNSLRDNTDAVNVLSAISSNIVIGQMYLPPQKFVELLLTVEPGGLFVYGNRRIGVTVPANYDALVRLPIEFKIEELQTTYLTITCNLDSLLLKRAEGYEFRPDFSVTH
jgi:hypothetical protein